jgi:hypothetical protein
MPTVGRPQKEKDAQAGKSKRKYKAASARIARTFIASDC